MESYEAGSFLAISQLKLDSQADVTSPFHREGAGCYWMTMKEGLAMAPPLSLRGMPPFCHCEER